MGTVDAFLYLVFMLTKNERAIAKHSGILIQDKTSIRQAKVILVRFSYIIFVSPIDEIQPLCR